MKVLPPLPIQKTTQTEFPTDSIQNLVRSEIADWLQDFYQPMNGVFRSKAHLDYIIPSKLSDQVRALSVQLKQCWSQTIVPPIRLHYYSARLHMDSEVPPLSLVVYPVRLDYLQRATYLYAYGQQPANEPVSDQVGWYDYRMDRIVDIEPLTWDDNAVPPVLRQHFCQKILPSVSDLDVAQGEVWGYEVHQPSSNLLIRFESYFYAQYVKDTERSILLSPITPKKVQTLIQTEPALINHQRSALLQNVTNRHKNSIYCHVKHRLNDHNIIMRMRAWGPKVEVLLPWQLRQTMAHDAKRLTDLYMIES